MITRPFILLIALLAVQRVQISAAPTTSPSTQAGANDDQTNRFTFLGNQLTADEAAIDAINKALLQQGYKAAVADGKAATAVKGNELMDRNAGAPVRWENFYGRTAKDFIMHDTASPVYHQVQRPKQFDYVYHANNSQIDAAKAEVDSIGKKVDALLAQRKKLEAEQSALWAKIAFESIGNRDIALIPLYRNKLKADPAKFDDNKPEPPTVKALAAAVLYVRTANAAATGLDNTLDTDQGACYTALRSALDANFKSLQEAQANFNDAASADPTQIRQMAGIVSVAKSILSLCTDLHEAYGKAQDAEQANEEARRQLYRAAMQESLFGFAEAVGKLDDQLEQLSSSWSIQPVHGEQSADKVPDIAAVPGVKSTSATPASPPPSTPSSAPSQSAAKPDVDGWVDLFNGKDTTGWAPAGNNATAWAVNDGILTGTCDGHSHLVTNKRDYEDFDLRVEAQINAGGNSGVFFRVTAQKPSRGGYQAQISDATDRDPKKTGSLAYFGETPAQSKDPVALNESSVPPGEWFTMEIVCQGPHITILVNGNKTADYIETDNIPRSGAIALESFHAVAKFRKVQIKELKAPAAVEPTGPTAQSNASAPKPPVAVPSVQSDAETAKTSHGATINWLQSYLSGQTALPAGWSVAGGELQKADRGGPLKLDCDQTGAFDLHFEYTPLTSTTVSVTHFDYKNFHCWYILGDKSIGFAHEPNAWARGGWTQQGPSVTAGHRYSLVIQVRPGSMNAFLDGKQMHRFTPNEQNLKIDSNAPLAPHAVNLAIHGSAIVHVAELQMVGPGYVDTSQIVPAQSATPSTTGSATPGQP